MSGVRNTKAKSDVEQAEEAQQIERPVTADELKEQGFVLEVTARDPHVIKDNKLVPGEAFDHWHHACQKEKCTHKDKSSAGKWVKLSAQDDSRSVN